VEDDRAPDDVAEIEAAEEVDDGYEGWQLAHRRTIGQLVGENLRALRIERGLTQSEAVIAIRQAGLAWDRHNIAALETGRRAELEIGELILLSAAFSVPIGRWFADPRVGIEVRIGRLAPCIPASHLHEAFRDVVVEVPRNPLLDTEQLQKSVTQETRPLTDAERGLAARIGLPPEEVRSLAIELWGRPLEQERDRRLQKADPNLAKVPAYRAQATRRLRTELEEAIAAAMATVHWSKKRPFGHEDAARFLHVFRMWLKQNREGRPPRPTPRPVPSTNSIVVRREPGTSPEGDQP
jgi:transcriptional regulator with XRE-family HTH domain